MPQAPRPMEEEAAEDPDWSEPDARGALYRLYVAGLTARRQWPSRQL